MSVKKKTVILHFLYSALDKIITGNISRTKPTEIFNR
jgi:hypothetical protein